MAKLNTIKEIFENLIKQYEDGTGMSNNDTQLLLAALYFYWRHDVRSRRFSELMEMMNDAYIMGQSERDKMPDYEESPAKPPNPDEEDED